MVGAREPPVKAAGAATLPRRARQVAEGRKTADGPKVVRVPKARKAGVAAAEVVAAPQAQA